MCPKNVLIDENESKLASWFMNSPICLPDGRYRVYYSNAKTGPVYPEITSYALSVACLLYKKYGSEQFIEIAKKSAHYLSAIAPAGGLPSYGDDFKYTFDTGIFISGLFDLYEVSKDQKYLSEARKNLDWLSVFFDDVKFRAINGQGDPQKWAHCSAVHLAKLAIPLIKAWVFLRDERYKKAAQKLLCWAEKLQTEDGRFMISETMNETMTHAHCYATEGFFFAYHHLGAEQSSLLTTVKKSADWLARVQNKDGSFYKWYFKNSGIKDRIVRLKITDATSQAVRIWKVLGVHEENIKRACRFLESNTKKDGGLILNKYKFLVFEKAASKVYSWPTFFYIHALMLPFNKIEYAGDIF